MTTFLQGRKRRYSDNNAHFGPFTLSRHGSENWRPLGAVLDSGDDDESPGCHLRLHGFGYTLICELPAITKPWRRWVDTSKYEWSKMPGGGYWDKHKREFGITVSDGFVQVFLGPQTHDSTTTKSWCKHLPWTQWRFYRHSYFDLDGNLHWTQLDRDRKRPFAAHGFDVQQRAQETCPSASFAFDDYDGKRIVAKTVIEQREWKFGEGRFRWLSLFRRDMVRRSLKIDFSDEVGPEKGSWKGGTCGTSIDMLPGELHEAAFRRYCTQEHRSKYSKYSIKFIAVVV